MVLLTSFFAVALLHTCTGSVQGDSVSRKVGDREISFKWPPGTSVPGESLVWNGNRISIGERGNLAALDSSKNDWVAIRKKYETATGLQTETTPIWRTKVYLLPRTNVLNRGEILRVRRNWLEKEQIDQVYVALAEWSVRVESAMNGRLRVQIDVETDLDENYQDASPISTPFDAKWLRTYASSRFNGFDFQSDDKIYRGPFDSVWVLHSGLTPFASRSDIWETPVTCVSISNLIAKRDDISRRFLEIWNEDLRTSAKHHGYRLEPDSTERFQITDQSLDLPLSAGTLANLFSSREPSSIDFSTRAQSKGSVEGVRYSEVQDDPVGKVGMLSDEQMAQILGAKLEVTNRANSVILTGQGLAMNMISGSTALDAVFESDQEASALVLGTGKELLFVKLAFLDLFGEKLVSAKFHGFVQIGRESFGVFSIANLKPDLQECELIGHPKVNQTHRTTNFEPKEIQFFSGDSSRIIANGQFTATSQSDPGKGNVSLIDFGKSLRVGEAVIYDSTITNGGIESRNRPKFSFWIKSSQVEPLLIRFEFQNSSPRQVRLFGRWPTPEDSELTPVGAEIECAADGEWHQVFVDLRALGPSTGRAIVNRVVLASDPLAESWGRGFAASSSLLLGAASAEPTTEPVPVYAPSASAQPDSASANPEDRARWAASATDSTEDVAKLLVLIKDRVDLVRINAAAAFQRIRSTIAEPVLIDALNTLDARQAQAVIEALRFQNSDSAWNAISRTFLGPPLDSHRMFAAYALGERKLPSTTGTLSTGFASRSWQARYASAQSISKMGSRESSLLLIVFIQESVPEIRQFVAANADVSNETVCRRLQYSAVNDPSDAVRAACHWRLAHSTIPAFALEGWKGIRDDSPFVRLFILDRILENPSQDSRSALILAISDIDPRVRVRALRCLARLPGDVKIEELGQIPNDTDYRVQEAFRDLKSAKGISEDKLPFLIVK
jgi:HEAT repeat protein